VMHELLLSKATTQVPKGTKQALVKINCEYPCAKFKGEEQDETEAELSNTFFFDNISLGFYRK